MPRKEPKPLRDRVYDKIKVAADAVQDLRHQVDPGHVPMIDSLKQLEFRLLKEAKYLRDLCDKESGG